MGTRRLGYRLALPLAGIVVAAGFAMAPSAQAFLLPDADREPVQTREVCGDVLFLGARGSGQAAGGAAVDAGTGMGPQVYAAYQRMVSDRPDRTIAPRAVFYPAQEVQAIALNAGAYFSGLEQGVRDVKRTLRSEALRCPDQRLVLAGYSQGAMVMHRALQDLSTAKDPAAVDILARLSGVSSETILAYHEHGLLHPAAAVSAQPTFDDESLRRLADVTAGAVQELARELVARPLSIAAVGTVDPTQLDGLAIQPANAQ